LRKIISCLPILLFFFSSRRRHTISKRDWSSDVCSSDLPIISRFGFVAKKYSKPSFITAPNKLLNIAGLAKSIASNADCKGACIRSEERRVGKVSTSRCRLHEYRQTKRHREQRAQAHPDR